jgi:hypothetical protein
VHGASYKLFAGSALAIDQDGAAGGCCCCVVVDVVDGSLLETAAEASAFLTTIFVVGLFSVGKGVVCTVSPLSAVGLLESAAVVVITVAGASVVVVAGTVTGLVFSEDAFVTVVGVVDVAAEF